MKHCLILLIWVLVFSGIALPSLGAGEEPGKGPDITAEVDRNEINIGDRIKLDIFAENPGRTEFSFPKKPEEAGEFTFIGSREFKTGWGKREKVGREYWVSIYTTGTHVIPPVRVRYRSSEDGRWDIARSPQVPIMVTSLLTGEDSDIRDVKGLELFGMGKVLIIIVLLLVLAAGATAWILRMRKIRQGGAARRVAMSADEIAHEQLRQLKAMDLPGQGRVKEYYTRLSDIVRQYLEDRFSFRAPEMTTEEFMEAVKQSPVLIEEHKELLKDFLSHCDMVKFAKYGPTPLEMVDSFNSAERLVDQTSHEEEKEEEGGRE